MDNATHSSTAPTNDQRPAADVDAPRTFGERLLPVLVLALESCLLYALLLGVASLHFLGSDAPLLPIWPIFGVNLSIYWLASVLQHIRVRQQATGLYAWLLANIPRLVCTLLALGLAWLFIALPIGSPFAFETQQHLLNTLLHAQALSYRALVVIGVLIYTGWRGLYRAREGIEQQVIKQLMRIGLSCFLLVVLCSYGAQAVLHEGAQYILTLLLLIPVFLLLALLAQALSQVSYLRHFHAVGLHGSARFQERVIFRAMALLVVVCSGVIFGISEVTRPGDLSAAFAGLGILPGWLTDGLTQVPAQIWQIIVWVWTPIGNFLLWLLSLLPAPPSDKSVRNVSCQQLLDLQARLKHKINLPPACLSRPAKHLVSIPNLLLITLLEIALPTLVVGVMLYLLWRKYRSIREEQARAQQGEGDIHESIWSWELFWNQLHALALAWLGWLWPFRQKGQAGQEQENDDIVLTTPAARSIRDTYRAFLRRAARKGYPRARNETASEFRLRLHTRDSLVEPELEMITHAYILIRYGGNIPSEHDVATIRQTWSVLERKW